MSTPGVRSPAATRAAPTPSTAAWATSRQQRHEREVGGDQPLRAHPGPPVGVAALAEPAGAVLLADEGLRDPHPGDVLLQVGVDHADLLAGLGVRRDELRRKSTVATSSTGSAASATSASSASVTSSATATPTNGEHADHRLGQPGLQERRQRVDVGGHPGHDPAGQLALVVVQPEPLQVGEAAHPQQVEQALPGPRGDHGLRGDHQPAHGHQPDPEQGGHDAAPTASRR